MFIGMIFLISKLDTSDDVSEHYSAKYEISRHQHLFDEHLIFRTENHISPEKKKPYDYREEKKDSLDDFK